MNHGLPASTHWLSLWWMALFGAAGLMAQEPIDGPRVYLIGNSLTWDCVPAALGVQAQWHVDCGKNLQQIYDAPQKPCVPSSLVWTKALTENQYDVLCVQPHNGTTLQQDIQRIQQWLKLQPQAVLVLHSGWARHKDLDAEMQSASGRSAQNLPMEAKMQHSAQYLERLQAELSQRFPEREIRQTYVYAVLHQIAEDIQQQRAPLKSISELYRDDIHLTFQAGRYVAHNMLRQSLGLPIGTQGFQLDDDVKTYLDQKMTRYREVK